MVTSGVKTPTSKEDDLGRKWDRCVTDLMVKLGGGVLLGGVVSLMFFKRKTWPIYLMTGFGSGMSYSNCEKDINFSITSSGKQDKM